MHQAFLYHSKLWKNPSSSLQIMQNITLNQLQIMQKKNTRFNKSENSYRKLNIEDEFWVNIYYLATHV